MVLLLSAPVVLVDEVLKAVSRRWGAQSWIPRVLYKCRRILKHLAMELHVLAARKGRAAAHRVPYRRSPAYEFL